MDIRVKLAKNFTEHFVPSLPPELNRQQACYVYLYQKPGQRLRATYGHPLPRHSSLAEEIRGNIIQALSGSAFINVRRSDLTSLSYSVAALDPLQRISDMTHLDPHRYGLYVTSDRGKINVILPQRPGITTAQDQLATALREAGINHHQEAIAMYRFGVTYYE